MVAVRSHIGQRVKTLTILAFSRLHECMSTAKSSPPNNFKNSQPTPASQVSAGPNPDANSGFGAQSAAETSAIVQEFGIEEPYATYLETALTAAHGASEILQSHFGRLNSIDEKFQAGLVSEADRNSEKFIV